MEEDFVKAWEQMEIEIWRMQDVVVEKEY